ncbi:MAG: hypothetical protein KJ737_05120 [Proteobacteria bacterium]|nr:hypothetical protein [Pseudomonadota bacterium]
MVHLEDLEKIKQFVFSETGLVYYRDKEAELCRKIYKAVKRSGARDYRQYMTMLRSGHNKKSREFDNLVSKLIIGETHFFRDEKLFNGVEDVVLPAVIEKNKSRKRLWIWSAGCATGEEAYSVSILINRHFPQLLQEWDIRVVGFDRILSYDEIRLDVMTEERCISKCTTAQKGFSSLMGGHSGQRLSPL